MHGTSFLKERREKTKSAEWRKRGQNEYRIHSDPWNQGSKLIKNLNSSRQLNIKKSVCMKPCQPGLCINNIIIYNILYSALYNWTKITLKRLHGSGLIFQPDSRQQGSLICILYTRYSMFVSDCWYLKYCSKIRKMSFNGDKNIA